MTATYAALGLTFAPLTIGTVYGIIKDCVSIKKVGGLTFIKVGRFSMSYCITKA